MNELWVYYAVMWLLPCDRFFIGGLCGVAYDVYEVNGMKIQNGQIVKTDPNNADSDNDGVSDFDEIGCAPVAEVVKFLKSEYSCVIFKSKSNPWASDSDGDYYSDDIDEYPNKWNKSSIRDKYIDDTDSAKGKNPVESSYVYTNGVLTQITMGEGGTMKKNAYSFTRSNDSKYKHNGYSATFSLRPKKQSFYAITVTNVNNKADVDIKVTYVDEGIFKDKTIKVNQYSDATDDKDNHTATFYYLLEPDNDTSYTICINNNTNEICREHGLSVIRFIKMKKKMADKNISVEDIEEMIDGISENTEENDDERVVRPLSERRLSVCDSRPQR